MTKRVVTDKRSPEFKSKLRKKRIKMLKIILFLLVLAGLIAAGIVQEENYFFGISLIWAILWLLTQSSIGKKLFSFTVGAGAYLFYSAFTHLTVGILVFVLGLEIERDYLYWIYFVVLGIELFFSAIIDGRSMTRKNIGESLSTVIVTAIVILWILGQVDLLDFDHHLQLVQWKYVVMLLVYQFTELWISSKLKPLSLRHFGDLDKDI